jgi:copper homeostasis protein
MREYLFEVCANSVESCMAAQAGGADRVELCAGIPEGGTTPSYGDIVIAREVLQNTRLHVIIRPRGGDFLYSPIEQHIMLKDIDNARRLEADGIVLGCLTPDGEVDIPLMKQLMEAAQGMSVTFHRAFDVCRNPQKALEDIISLGCDRILTSGQQPTAELGIPLLKELQQQAAGRGGRQAAGPDRDLGGSFPQPDPFAGTAAAPGCGAGPAAGQFSLGGSAGRHQLFRLL